MRINTFSPSKCLLYITIFINGNNKKYNPKLIHALSTPNPFGSTSKNIATQILQGAGPTLVDLNQYNIESLDRIQNEWTANVVQKVNEKEVYTRLDVKSEKELFVDVVSVTFPRVADGMGIELLEIAGGGKESQLGITLISGVTKGGPADGQDIRIGDSISKVSVIYRKKMEKPLVDDDDDDDDDDNDDVGVTNLSEIQDEFTVNTECLSFDATIDALSTLPSQQSDATYDVYYNLRLKRIRRKPKVTVKLQYPPSQNEPDTTLELFAGENLRQGMLIRGVKLNDPLAQRFDTKSGGNCGAGGLCRTCAVSIMQGNDLLNPQRLAEQQMLADDNPRWRLACKAIVGFGMREGNMTVQVNPRQWIS